MSRREAALKARKELEKYKNCNDIESRESDEEINNENESEDEDNANKSVIYSSNDDEDDDIDDIYQHIDEAIESVIQNMNDPDVIDPNLDKTSKSNVIWTRLKNPKTPSQNKKRSLSSSNTPVSSKKANLDSRKKCQVRLCKGNKTNITCIFCTKPTCGVCLHEQKVEAVCKIFDDNGKKL